MPRIIAIGETMLELGGSEKEGWRLSLGGDTFNTAVHCARRGVDVAYVTALGQDPFSDEMLGRFEAEGVATDLVLRAHDRLPGLYAIKTDGEGERSFYYWRENSAARGLFALPGIDAVLQSAARADLLYLSGITLSLYDQSGREKLACLAEDVRRAGGQVAFDPNYRPSGWSGRDVAKAAINAFARHVDIALPTFDDERALHGDTTPQDTIDRWRALGAREIVVKTGPDGCLVAHEPQHLAVTPRKYLRPIDTTGAGDSFNAAYLTARLSGASETDAAIAGNMLAGEVIMHVGAIGPRQG